MNQDNEDADTPEAPGGGEAVNEPSPAEAPEATLPPLTLTAGARIRLGYRSGTVEQVRGRWAWPYDIRIRWDGEKHPQYIVFTSLARDYQAKRLTLL